MRIGLVADLHANRGALDEVLRRLAHESVDEIVVLGDLVGYNAEPEETVSCVRAVGARVLAGNHDKEVLAGSSVSGTSSAARVVAQWTRAQLSRESLDYLSGLPTRLHGDGWVATHGSYLNDEGVQGYVTGTMLEANLRAVASKHGVPLAFCGHTHLPMCGWLDGGQVEERIVREGVVSWPRAASVVLVNPGAVGQPRDGDPRACFAVVDVGSRTVTFGRETYPVGQAQRRILDAALPPSLAGRLGEGRLSECLPGGVWGPSEESVSGGRRQNTADRVQQLGQPVRLVQDLCCPGRDDLVP